jgi:hypothetical protein
MQFLLKNGIAYNGDVSIWGGSSMTNAAGVGPEFRLQANAWVGLEGTGTAEYKGKILIARWDNHATYGNRGYSAVFYATNGGTAIFSGNIHETTVNGTDMGQKAFITGGGEVRFASTTVASITNTVQVMSNTTFRLDGSLATSMLTVDSGSKLQGVGSVNNVTANGIVAPGNSIGTLTVSGDAGVYNGFEAELSLTDGTSDLLAVGGVLDITGATLKLFGGKAGETYTIATYGDTLSGAFASIDLSGLGAGLELDTSTYKSGINYGDGEADSISLTVIPEPASILLMLSGIVGAYKLRRRS